METNFERNDFRCWLSEWDSFLKMNKGNFVGGYVKKLLGRIVTFFEVFLVWVANCFTLVFFSPKQEEEDDRLGRWSQYQSDVPALILFLSFVFFVFFLNLIFQMIASFPILASMASSDWLMLLLPSWTERDFFVVKFGIKLMNRFRRNQQTVTGFNTFFL